MSAEREPWFDNWADEELQRRRDVNAQAAEVLLFGVGRYEETYAGDMAAAAAHATLALLTDAVLARRARNRKSQPEEPTP